MALAMTERMCSDLKRGMRRVAREVSDHVLHHDAHQHPLDVVRMK